MKIMVIILSLLLINCALIKPRQSVNLTVYKVKKIVEERTLKDMCAFNLTTLQAQDYFNRAEIIPFSRKDNDQTLWTPCYIEGYAKINNDTCYFHIYYGGKAFLACKYKKNLLLNCPKCYKWKP